MTRIGFLVGLYKSKCRQYLDIPFHCSPVPLENNSQVRNGRRLLAHRVEHTNALGGEHPEQISRIFKDQAHLRGESLATVQLTSTIQRSLDRKSTRLNSSHL